MKQVLGMMRRACDAFSMIEEGDRIAIGVSGGKDSMLLLYAMGLYRQYIKKDFSFLSLTVDVGFPGFAGEAIADFARSLGVEHHTEKTEINQIVFETRKEKNPCALCSKMRKGALYDAAVRLGCNKVAFAHNLEDLLETFVLSFVYEGRLSTFAPVTHLSRTGITLIRPFLYLPEKEIIGTVRQKGIPVYKNPCPVDGSTKRVVAREFINLFLKHNPDAKKSMLAAIKSAGTYNFFDLPPGLRQLAQREPFTEQP